MIRFIILFILFSVSNRGLSQNYIFNGTISRTTLENYLKRSASAVLLSDVAEVCHPQGGPNYAPFYTDQELDQDIIMMKNIRPKFLGRVAGQWTVRSHQGELDRADTIARRIHDEVDTDIILQAAIFENIGDCLDSKDIEIPAYVQVAFGLPIQSDTFRKNDIVYVDSPKTVICNTGTRIFITHNETVPDISRVGAQMWFYYKATQYIMRGYEAIHFGDFDRMDKNDKNNSHKGWGTTLSKIRDFAHNGFIGTYYDIDENEVIIELPGARRGLVICDAHFTNKYDTNPIERPYWTDGYGQTRLLFDILASTSKVLEGEEIIGINSNTLFDAYTRTGYIDGVKLDESYGISDYYPGQSFQILSANNWGWSNAELQALPYLVELDSGGPAPTDCIGKRTDGSISCNAGQCQTLKPGNYAFKTWGWDEFTWFALQNEAYRDHFLYYMYREVKKEDPENGFFQVPLRREMEIFECDSLLGLSPCDPGRFYRATTGAGNQEETIKDIWDTYESSPDDWEVDFCAPILAVTNFGYSAGSWRYDDHIRTLADVNNDGRPDIVGFGNSGVHVSLSNSSGSSTSFASLSTWANGLYGKNGGQPWGGWNLTNHVRLLGDIDGVSGADIVGFGTDNVRGATSNGVNAFTNFSNWTFGTLFGNNGSQWTGGYDNAKHYRMLGDADDDGRDDIITISDIGIAYSRSLPTSQFQWPVATGLFSVNGTQPVGGWIKGRHHILLGDVDGGGNSTDIVGFGEDGVSVRMFNVTSYSGGSSMWSNDFGCNDGYLPDVIDPNPRLNQSLFNDDSKYIPIRTVADVNGDGQDDLVGFNRYGVQIGLSKANGTGFESAEYWINNYGFESVAGGWKNDNPRLMADVNGDNKADIIGFGNEGIMISLSTGISFLPFERAAYFGNNTAAGTWGDYHYIRTAVDIDGDSRAEIIGFKDNGVYVMNCSGVSTFRTSLPEVSEQKLTPEITIYPNPNSGRGVIELRILEESEVSLIIYDLFGKQISLVAQDKHFDQGTHKIKFHEALPNGVYILSARIKDEKITTKFVVQ